MEKLKHPEEVTLRIINNRSHAARGHNPGETFRVRREKIGKWHCNEHPKIAKGIPTYKCCYECIGQVAAPWHCNGPQCWGVTSPEEYCLEIVEDGKAKAQ